MTTLRPCTRRSAYAASALLLAVAVGVASGCSSSDAPPAAAGGGGSTATAGNAGTTGLGGSTGAVAGANPAAGIGGTTAGGGGAAGNGGTSGMACAMGDECCTDPLKTEPGDCGCGIPDVDDDSDGTLNCKETCPADPKKTEPGMCGCGAVDRDSDNDGEIDCGQGSYLEAEDGVLSVVDAPFVPVGEGGAGSGEGGGGGEGNDAVGGADSMGAGGVMGAGGEASAAQGYTIGEDAMASNGEYIEAPAGLLADFGPGPARATYTFDVEADGNYAFWGRFYGADIDHNRFWVKVDDGQWTRLTATSGEEWFWISFHLPGQFETPIRYELTEGEHTLMVASATDQFKIDRFYYTPAADVPPGNDSDCNPPHSVKSGDLCQMSCGALMGTSCDPTLCAGETLLPAYDCKVCCAP